MHKVIVERPRWTPGPDKHVRRANLSDEILPKFEGIKRMHTQRKGQRDLLGPLRRWLHSKAGRPWNDVYSEACAVSHPDNYVRVHVKTHLLQFVERHTFMHGGKVCVLDTVYQSRGIIPVTERHYGWKLFFVHPESGLLCEIPRFPRPRWRDKNAVRRSLTQRWVNETTVLRRLVGCWFECRVETFPRRTLKGDSPWRYDFADKKLICRSTAWEIYGRDVFCVAKRQLSHRELRQQGLHNSAAFQNTVFYRLLLLPIEDCILHSEVRASQSQQAL